MTNMQRKTVNYKWLINSVNIMTEMHSYGKLRPQPLNHQLQRKTFVPS